MKSAAQVLLDMLECLQYQECSLGPSELQIPCRCQCIRVMCRCTVSRAHGFDEVESTWGNNCVAADEYRNLLIGQVQQTLEGWRLYLRQPILPASLAYIMLYFNAVLGPGGLMTAFLASRGLSGTAAALFRHGYSPHVVKRLSCTKGQCHMRQG